MSPEAQQQVDSDESTSLVLQAANVKVTDDESYKTAANLRAHVGTAREYFEKLYRPRIDEAHKHHKSLLADLKRFDGPLAEAWERLGRLITTYDDEKERQRVKAQREAEAKAKADAEAAKQRELQIAKDLGLGKDVVKEIKAAPIEPEPVVVAKETPKIDGLHYTTNKHYEVVDMALLVKSVANGSTPIGALEYKASFLNNQTHSLFDSIKPDKDGVKWLYPGVKIWTTRAPVQKG